MSSNDVRPLALRVLADGVPVPGVLDLDVLSNAHLAADRFRFRAAMPPALAASLFDAGPLLDLQVSCGGRPISLLQGEADTIHIDVTRSTVEVDGRDLTGRLIDARTQETFANQTASEIATTLARRNGLAAEVMTTATLAGRYYGAEHDRVVLGQFSRATTEWDLLTFLAGQEGFEVFVAGQTLFFQPRSLLVEPMLLAPGDCIALSLERSLTLARSIEVTVKSWNTRHQAAFSQTARSSGPGRRGGGRQRIVVVRPNLSPNEALQMAQRILADLSAHERLVHAELPGELALQPRSRVLLTGTGTDFDQTYYVAELDRHFSADHGFTQRLRLKNGEPVSGATPPADDPTPIG